MSQQNEGKDAQNEGKDVRGRSWDQVTGGTTSAATLGAGSTGEVGASAERNDPARQRPDAPGQGGQGAAGRTDDLLAGGSQAEQLDHGFQSGAGKRPGAGPDRQGEHAPQDSRNPRRE